MQAVVFGAGNIGRSFIGQLFAAGGYHVTFIDVNETLVAELNRRGRYRIEVKGPQPAELWVEGVSALDARDRPQVAEALVRADIAATSVGAGALPHVYPTLADGLRRRREQGRPPLDVLILENLRYAAEAFTAGLREHLPPDFPLEESVGLVETSVGKMVPIMPEAVRDQDPLVVYAEAYNTLPVDATAFRNPIPPFPGLDPKQHMAAHVDRKSFIHNLGHAVAAYVGYLSDPSLTYIWEAVEQAPLRQAAAHVMWESARALMRRYPREFNEQNQGEHIEDLLNRFANRALGDTIFRVGRDLPRKLSREDRIVGALLLDAEEEVPAPATSLTLAAGFFFRGTDEHGDLFPADAQFVHDLETKGVEWVLTHVCGLHEAVPREARLRADAAQCYAYLQHRPPDWLTAFGRRPPATWGRPPW